MFATWLRRLATRTHQPLTGGRRSHRRAASSRPQLGRLEDRVTPATLLALNATGTSLLRFDSATPGTVVTTPITGLAANETVQGIDFRPATGQLFGLGVAGSTGRLLTIHPGTGAATVVGTLSQLLGGTDFGFDFNPTNDRIRITSDFDINYLVNPNDAVVTVQGTLNPGNPNVVGSAYTNSFPNATITTLFAIDSNTDQLLQQVPATGTLSVVGNLGVNTSGSVGFDVPGNTNNPAFAALTVGGVSSLYTLNTSSGAATLVGQIGTGAQVRGLAVQRFVWDGTPDTGGASPDPNWTTASNWLGDVAPAAGDDLLFPGSAALAATSFNNFAAGTTFNSITFIGSGYNITGNGITLNAGILDSATVGNNRLDLDITLAGTQIFSVANAGETLSLGGVISGAGSLNKERIGATTANAGTLRLDGAASNTFTGTLSVNGGVLELAKDGGATTAIAVPTALVVGDGTGADTARAFFSNQLGDTANVTVNAGGLYDLNNRVDTIANLTLNAGQFTSGTGTLTVSGTTLINGTTGDDAFVVAGTPAATTVSVNGVVSGNFVGGFTVDGLGGTDTLTGPDLANLWNLTGTNAGNIGGAAAIQFNNVENLTGGTDADLFVLANGAGVTGTINGGAGTDTLDYSAYTTVVAANLGLGATGFVANLDADQEVGPNTSTATGTATLTYNVTARTFDINVTVSGLAPADVNGFHIHRAPAGVNGPIIVDFVPGGVPIAPLVPSGDGFTFTATNISLAALHEAALLGGLTYVNIHTAAFPGGIIRGQVFSTGNANLSGVGTATGTGGIANFENATGGSGATTIGTATFGDSLVGSFGVNTLRGGDGNDVLVAGPGADTMQGEVGDDFLVWSNGDGSDVMDGGAGTDAVNVNGNVTANDVFTVAASATAGRVAFARTSPGPFTLDIGTVETLTVNGAGGNDSFSVNSLAGVADLSTVNLHGFDGNDTFNVRSDAAVTINVLGHLPRTAPGDTLNFDPAGLAFVDTGTQFQQLGRQPVNYAQIEAVAFVGPVTVTGTAGDDTLVVNATGPDSGTYSLNGATPVGFTGATTFTFDGGDGNDLLRINNPAGGLFAPTGGITFTGGGQAGDALENLGGAAASGTYSVGPGNGDGTLTHTSGALTQTITFTGLAPVTDTVTEATFTVNATDTANTITVDNGTTAGDGLARVAVDAFEPVEFANKTAVIVNGDLTAGGVGDQFVLSVTEAATGLTTLTLNGLAGDDTFQVVAVPTGPSVVIDGGAGTDTLTGPDAAAAWTVTGADQGAITGFVGSFLSVENLTGGSDSDTFAFQPGGSVTGTVTGGAGTDTIDYTAVTTPVSVNLGSNSPTLTASLDGDQETPANDSAGTGSSTITYNNVTRTFDINVTVTGIPLAQVTGFHIHRAQTGLAGPIIVFLDAPGVGTFTPTADGFTYTATGVALPAVHEAALLGGLTYLNVHTPAFPGGEIRGQIFAGGLFVAAPGTATNTGGITGIENATGGNSIGQFGDSLVGDLGANILRGNLGNDAIVGSHGADTMEGGSAAEQLLGLATGNTLVRFAGNDPGTPLATVPITGLVGGETVVGIDVRPANGQVYGLTDQGRLYILNPFTGAAALASTLSGAALAGTAFGIDFNPVPDRLRIVSNTDQNLRVNVDTGAVTVDGGLAFAAGDLNFGVDPNLVAAAYANNVAGATTTTLYGIDSNLDILVTQNPPNDGTLNTIGGLGFDTSDSVGFNIAGGNLAFASLTAPAGGSSSLFAINLTTGVATLVGVIGGGVPLAGLTALPDNDIMVWSNGDGSDVIDGGAGSDLVNVNGALGADDVFTIGAGAAGRVAFARTSPGPFTLDIGTAEGLLVSGVTGNDSFSVNDLTGVTDLTRITLAGFDGDDTFNVQPDANAAINVLGNLPRTGTGDTLNLTLGGATNATITATNSPTGFSGAFGFGNRQPVTFQQVETLSPRGSDLSITKTDGQTTVAPGTQITYTIVVTNNGPFDLTGVAIADTFPAALTGVTFTAVGFGGATGFTSLGTGNIADTVAMPALSSITYTITGTLDPAATGTLDNTATVTGPATQTDPNPANNTATDSNTIANLADLAVTKSDNPDPVVSGRNLTYTITVSNAGPNDATSVLLSDPLPAGTTLVSFTQTVGPTFTLVSPPVGTNGTVTATSALLASGATATFSLVVRVDPGVANGTVLANTATVTTTTVDPNPANDTVTINTTVRRTLLPLVTGAGAGGGPHVKVFDPLTGTLKFSFFAYDPSFGGGVRVAAGDVTGDGVADIITGAGPGGGPHVKVFDGVTGAEVRSFFAFPGFQGGVFVGAGDVNNDGFADVIVGAGAGGGPHVRAFSGANGSILANFFAYAAAFGGGVTVAGGDVNNDGNADIITGAGPGGGPHVKAFSGAGGAELRSFYAFPVTFSGGVFMATGDLNNDNVADIIAGTGPGTPALVRGFNGNTLAQIFAASPYGDFAGGARVGVADFDGDGQLDVATGAGPGGGPHVRVLDGSTQANLANFFAYDPAFLGGVFVG